MIDPDHVWPAGLVYDACGMAPTTDNSGLVRLAWQKNLPNLLTCLRLLLAAGFFVILSAHPYAAHHRERELSATGDFDGVLIFAAAVFVLAAITDALDGYLARRWNCVSVFGRVMDPFADKILIIGAFALLASKHFVVETAAIGGVGPSTGGRGMASFVESWMVIVIVARELLVTSLRAVVESKGVSFAATLSGKLKMVLQSVCVPVVLVYLARPVGPVPRPLMPDGVSGSAQDVFAIATRWLVWFTIAVTLWSAVPYLRRAVRAMR